MTERDDVLHELGQKVKDAREAAGLTLESVFDRTKIRPEYLSGIEEGNYQGFPETVYVKGFIRTYLKLVNANELYEDFASVLDSKDSPRKQDNRSHPHKTMKNILGNGSSLPEGFKPASHFWLFLVLVVALIGTLSYVWYAVKFGGLDLTKLKLFNFSGAGGPMTSVHTSSGDVNNGLIDVEIENVALSDDVSEDEEVEEEVRPSLEIRAVNDVWLSVAFGSSQPSFRRTLKRGDSMRWDLEQPARVVVGRPSAAQVILNGNDLGIINPSAKKSETYIYNPDGTYRRAK